MRRERRGAARKEFRRYQEEQQGLKTAEGLGKRVLREMEPTSSRINELSRLPLVFVPAGFSLTSAIVEEERPPSKVPEMIEAFDKSSMNV